MIIFILQVSQVQVVQQCEDVESAAYFASPGGGVRARHLPGILLTIVLPFEKLETILISWVQISDVSILYILEMGKLIQNYGHRRITATRMRTTGAPLTMTPISSAAQTFWDRV